MGGEGTPRSLALTACFGFELTEFGRWESKVLSCALASTVGSDGSFHTVVTQTASLKLFGTHMKIKGREYGKKICKEEGGW